MDTFFTILKKSLVASVFVMFALVATYIPQPDTPQVHATSIIGATFPQQIFDDIQQIYNNIVSAAQKAFDAIDKFMDKLTWQKDWLFDGLAWTVAKTIIGAMTQDLLNWVNSGFAGSPAFVTDTKGFLLDIANDEAGEYIASLGKFGSFICSPFQLDVKYAVALNYQQVGNPEEKEACSLTDIQGNLGAFIDGTQRSFEDGGWTNWIEITSKPVQYTPFGATQAAIGERHAKLTNAKGEEFDLLTFGDGFMSQETCAEVTEPNEEGGEVATKKCDITTPGKVISDALSKGVDSDRETLLAADEANEIFAAIVGQIGKSIFAEGASLISGF